MSNLTLALDFTPMGLPQTQFDLKILEDTKIIPGTPGQPATEKTKAVPPVEPKQVTVYTARLCYRVNDLQGLTLASDQPDPTSAIKEAAKAMRALADQISRSK